MDKIAEMRKMTIWESILLFSIPSAYFIIITNNLIPYLVKDLNLHPALGWFIGGYIVFVPLFILALIFYRREGNEFRIRLILDRLRIKRLSKNDWKWTITSSIVILISTGLIMFTSKILSEGFGFRELETTPSFMEFQALQGFEKFYLLIWIPMFFFNIVGEEILWRGYILPRQELQHGKYSWVINSVLWLVFHACFGLDLIILLIPILIVVPYVAYKTKNTSIGILTHGILNGPMFVLVSIGLIK
ncbi:MAG TPA: CPBP family intramembrane metalloprotease [Desulfosporosinus sp.]|nr:CPBP family intramembrane metalloprotease [Desulfosporosinus sp.]